MKARKAQSIAQIKLQTHTLKKLLPTVQIKKMDGDSVCRWHMYKHMTEMYMVQKNGMSSD